MRYVEADRALIEVWENQVGGWVEELMSEGLEAALLKPLADYPAAALCIVRHVSGWDNHRQRKVAATIVGLLGGAAPESALVSLLESEARRRGRASEPFEVLLNHSVVEDIVFAATRWCAVAERREAGLATLRAVVERTLGGEYWNTASYAMAGLVHHQAPDAALLLERFVEFAHGEPPRDPSNPSLGQERDVAGRLLSGHSDDIEQQLADADHLAARVTWDDEATRAVAQFLAAARDVQRTAN
jgi:hypothetical protein